MQIIGGKYKGKKLLMPKGSHVRPTTSRLREALFNIIGPSITNTNFLDLFAGSGAIGLEALSRGAATATFVEKHPLSIKAIQKNIEALNVKNETRLYAKEVFVTLKMLTRQKRTFDMIFADPPYGDKICDELLHYLDTYSLLTPQGVCFIEEEQPHTPPLSNLKLVSSRKMGSTYLKQFCPKSMSL